MSSPRGRDSGRTVIKVSVRAGIRFPFICVDESAVLGATRSYCAVDSQPSDEILSTTSEEFNNAILEAPRFSSLRTPTQSRRLHSLCGPGRRCGGASCLHHNFVSRFASIGQDITLNKTEVIPACSRSQELVLIPLLVTSSCLEQPLTRTCVVSRCSNGARAMERHS